MSEQPIKSYDDEQGPEVEGMAGPAHEDEGVEVEETEGDEDGVA